ncbi:putative CDP-diacylglycerol--glycerol-3-phosphate 3-phosphatidyl-transferase 2 [Pseudodesulfovibrio hydrargyri]|uniref:CDP-diacylglycerol--glycerol-3-phosphate 3-phosphatidyltransferase n=1 Tax=Pseudodesulfovibrio hydrargyri TaxID=2125990 RepID=A0A1J5MZG6_9BACT|nr:CDP-diacylglycerol--glycerol-3-phosphate 3-phosphatidyltransferase [Pseudodesulfovibrio hydrargyri]OIQ48803.1 putative CDP-diacylglycerol--glycerol-3-phosphate 3-phosphatidyl-transferase 2 [Pseudodesulfovibrio hydrargyri]
MPRDAIWTVPNILTIVRILLTPLFVVAYVGENFNLAWMLFLVAGLTDAFDGFLARVWDQRTQLGAVLDPLADKALLVTSFICLAAKGWIPFWFAVLVVSRDLIIVGGLAVLNFLGVDVKNRIRPIWISKFNTAVQIVLVVAVMIHRTFALDYGYLLGTLVAITAVSTSLSGIAYVRRGFELFSEQAEG